MWCVRGVFSMHVSVWCVEGCGNAWTVTQLQVHLAKVQSSAWLPPKVSVMH